MTPQFVKWIFTPASGELLRREWRAATLSGLSGLILSEHKAAHYEGPFYVYPDNDR